MLDMIDASRVRVIDHAKQWQDQDAVCYADVEADPLRRGGQNLIRGGFAAFGWWVYPRQRNFAAGQPNPFRLCIGPDLMKEKGLKK